MYRRMLFREKWKQLRRLFTTRKVRVRADMETVDYSNLISLIIGCSVIALCVIVYFMSQIYFKGCAKKSSQKSGGKQ